MDRPAVRRMCAGRPAQFSPRCGPARGRRARGAGRDARHASAAPIGIHLGVGGGPRGQDVSDSGGRRNADRQGQRRRSSLGGRARSTSSRWRARTRTPPFAGTTRTTSSSVPNITRAIWPTARTSRTAVARHAVSIASPFAKTGTMSWPTWISSTRRTRTKRPGRSAFIAL